MRLFSMKTIRALTDAGGRSIADHVDHLRRSLDAFGRKLRAAISVAVGETLSGAVQAVLRAALAELAGAEPSDERPSRYGSSYWGEAYDDWGGHHESYRGPP